MHDPKLNNVIGCRAHTHTCVYIYMLSTDDITRNLIDESLTTIKRPIEQGIIRNAGCIG